MEIKNNLGINPYQAQLDRTQTSDQAAQAARAGKAGETASFARTGDTVTLSPEAKLRAEATSAATNAPDVRQSRVDAIKARVESGEYSVDSRQIASRLLAEEPGLFE
ncbi:flagellar biosynthesis anti-sigma factor FlgM [Desulfovibrio sp. OttesenSCG-928-I05]|nr:flagellar biosynthesis anti-sigma factor FlgM [Desulfovibrio sp. OttesenSCG-928-I05]